MHYHLELVMPPAGDIKAAVSRIMSPFYEGNESEDASGHPFFDYWVIGGRYSGSKIEARIGTEKLDAFNAELKRRKITVSGIVFGKEELSPSSQIAEVDALWCEMFPESGITVAPMFRHAKDLPLDICKLTDVPSGLLAYRVIIAAPTYDGKGIEAVSMFSQDLWNGCNYEKTTWDAKFSTALSMHIERSQNYADGHKELVTPTPDWLAITIDYHS